MFHIKIHPFYFYAFEDTHYRLDQLIPHAHLQAKPKNVFASALLTLKTQPLDQAFIIYLFIKFLGSCFILKQI